MMLPALGFLVVRDWRRHKKRISLTVAGIALGVSTYFAIRTANAGLVGSLTQTVEQTAGRATLQITAAEVGVAEEVLEIARSTPGVTTAEPAIEVIAQGAFGDRAALLIIGVDTLGDGVVREYHFDTKTARVGDPLLFLAQPKSILISRALAEKHSLKEDDLFPVDTPGGRMELVVRGVFSPAGIGRVFGGQVAVLDVYSAQLLFNRARRFDRIDLVTDPNLPLEAVRNRLQGRLPPGYEVQRPVLRSRAIERDLAGLRHVITLTSFIALLVGIFLISNALHISVTQRWKQIGILRAVGVERRHVQWMFLLEAGLMGLIGSALGIIAGFLLSFYTTRWLKAFVTSAYGLITSPEAPAFDFRYAGESMFIGLASALVAGWLPARSASKLSPVAALQPAEIRPREKAFGIPVVITGMLMLCLGLGLTVWARPDPGRLYPYTFGALIGVGLLLTVPNVTQSVARLLRPLLDRCAGAAGALAGDAILSSPRRTSAAVAALTLGLGFVFSTAAVVRAQQSVISRWMNRMVYTDLIVMSGDAVRSRTYHMTEQFSARIASMPGVERADNVRFTLLPYRGDTVAVMAGDWLTWIERSGVLRQYGDSREMSRLTRAGRGAILSENLAARWNIRPGGRIRLAAPAGTLDEPVLGLIEDYSSEKGTIFISRTLYKQLWNDEAIDFINIDLKPGVDRDALRLKVMRAAEAQRLFVYTGDEFKSWVARLIERLFRFTYIELAIAAVVAMIAIANTLLISVSERKLEIGVMRAIGALRPQIQAMVVIEAACIAAIGILIGIIKGILDTFFLVRATAMIVGGFTLPFFIPVSFILLSIPIVVILALAAAWWPARNAARLPIRDAIAYE